MYHSKKIGVFISHIMGYYQKNVCQGIIDTALEYGYTAEIFTSLDGENLGEYGIGEKSILNVPNYADYSGIIFASDTYPLKELRAHILATLREKCICPIVEIGVTAPSFPAASLENNRTAGELTEHLICVHNYQRICYLGCTQERYFSDIREQYYRGVMAEHGLVTGDGDVFLCGYTEEDAAAALRHFTDAGKPDAVVCYNDRLALLFMMAAEKAGFCIPQDIAVTGCDASPEGSAITPGLTTVSFPVYELGEGAVKKLLAMIAGEEVSAMDCVPAAPIFRESCGCSHQAGINPLFFQHTLNERITSLECSILTSMRMSASMQRITDLDEGMDLLEQYIRGIEHCREFYLCLQGGWDSVSGRILELADMEDATPPCPEEILLKLAIRDGKRLPECSFRKNSLLPEHIYRANHSAYIYTPLFFEDKEFGYVALSYEGNKLDYHFQLVHWFMNLNQMLQDICEAKCSSLLIGQLEQLSTRDTLTGLYNKHGYLLREKQFLKQAEESECSVTCFLFELNNLRQIKDACGYEEGDFALQVMGHALSGNIRTGDVCARFDRDEFYLLTKDYTKKDADEFLTRVKQYLSNYNRLSVKPYTVRASGGYASHPAGQSISSEQIRSLFSAAAKAMNSIS